MRKAVAAVAVVLGLACSHERRPEGEVMFGTLTVEQGAISTSVLTDKLNLVHPVMTGCYRDALMNRRAAKGSMDLVLTGQRSGLGVDVTKNTLNDPRLTQCIVEAVKHVNLAADSATNPVFTAHWAVDFDPKD